MPAGLNRTDLNTTGISYRNGTPIALPIDFGNDVDWAPAPEHFGNPVPTSGTEQNKVTWATPDPTHFGNDVTLSTLATPTFTPPAGSYNVSQNVTIAVDANAEETYYTTDGSTPSPSNGTLYTHPITVGSSLTVKAISYAGGYSPSAIGSATYAIVSAFVALVASTAATDNGSFSSSITTSPIDTTGANFLIMCVGQYGFATTSVSDSYNNTWHALNPARGPGLPEYPQMFYAYAPTVGPGHTFNAFASPNDLSIAVAAFSGMDGTSSVYETGSVTTSPSGTGGTTQQAGVITPANAGDLIINALAWNNEGHYTPAVSGIDSGFTLLDSTGIGIYSAVILAYLIAPTVSAVNPTWTLVSPGAQGDFYATGAAFVQG